MSAPPTMLIPNPLGSFFNSILLASVFIGDFIGDFEGVNAGDFPGDLMGDFDPSTIPGDKVDRPGDFAGLICGDLPRDPGPLSNVAGIKIKAHCVKLKINYPLLQQGLG